MTAPQPRKPAGNSDGGKFAITDRPEGDATLGAEQQTIDPDDARRRVAAAFRARRTAEAIMLEALNGLEHEIATARQTIGWSQMLGRVRKAYPDCDGISVGVDDEWQAKPFGTRLSFRAWFPDRDPVPVTGHEINEDLRNSAGRLESAGWRFDVDDDRYRSADGIEADYQVVTARFGPTE